MPDVDERVRPVLNEALDDALRNYMTLQFLNWVRDYRPNQVERAAVGMHRAVAAYQNVRGLRNGIKASSEQLQEILRDGLDNGMRQYISKLFGVFLSESAGGVFISKSFDKGRENAIDAYIKVRDKIVQIK